MSSYRANNSATKFRNRVSAIFFALTLGMGSAAHAGPVQLPPVNLGDSSFTDGIAFPGLLVEETIGYYHADRINDSNGNGIPESPRVITESAMTHVAFLSTYKFLGGYYGAEFLLPLADVHVQSGPVDERTAAVGDLIVSPFILQWNEAKLMDKPLFQRFVFAVVLPTGDYDRNKAVNVGNNIYSINPYYAVTWLATDKVELSARLHYLWNSKNDDPFVGLGASSIQPGQAFHANYAASYEVLKGVRLGVNGYVLQQLTDHEVNGQKIGGTRERVYGIGPGAQLAAGKGFFIYLNSYFETGAENRPEGTKTVFRLSKGF